MVALASLQPASFRGARFLCPKDKASEGRNSIEHKYPDSPIRYVEDNGYCPPEFTLTAVLHGPRLISDFQALRAALNRVGPGTLHHPYYGAQLCSVKGPWTVNREDADSGVLTIEITFLVTSSAIFPAFALAIPAVVSGLVGSFISSALSRFALAFGVPALSVVSLVMIADRVRAAASAFYDVSGAPAVALGMAHIASSAEQYVANGALLAAQMESLWRGPFEDLTYSGGQIAETMRRVDAAMADTQAQAAAIIPSTLDLATRRDRLLTYAVYGRLVTLASLAEALASASYVSADGVHDAQSAILDLYGAIDLARVDTEIGESLKEVIGAALEVLRGMELQLPRIEAQRLPDPMPASVLAYMLYDGDERTDTLVDLNMGQCPILLEHEANVLIEAA